MPLPIRQMPWPSPLSHGREAIRDLMWRAAGLFRTRGSLARAAGMLDALQSRRASHDARGLASAQLVTVARLIARAALRREESRGGHFREDFPERDDAHWKIHLVETSAA